MKIDDETIRVEVEGDAARPVLVLSNSLGTDLSMWDAQMPALLDRFRVVRYDTRGHGGSVVPTDAISIERLGRDVLAILDALEIETAHFLGISMGGAIGQWLIAHAPARIERVVLACTAARFGTPDGWNSRILAVKRGGMKAIVATTMERWFGPDFAKRDPDAVARVRETFLACPPEGYVACCAALRDLDLHAAIEGAETPALVLTGAHDLVIDATATAKLLAALPNARHATLEACHIASIEAHPAFVEAVVGFLTAKLPARRRALRSTPTSAPRGRIARRVTAARLPLAKSSTIRKAKAAAAKTAAAKARKPQASRPKAQRPAPDTAKLAKAGPAATTKKASPTKKASANKKAKPTRRPTKAAAARGAVKTVTARTKPSKTAAKAAAKTKTKPTKRPPAARRKPTTPPRRPSGRRKT